MPKTKTKTKTPAPKKLGQAGVEAAKACEDELNNIIDFLKDCLIDDSSLLIAHRGEHLLTNRQLLKMKKEYARKTNALYETKVCPKNLRQSLDEVHHAINIIKPFVKREIDSGNEGSVAQIILTLWTCQEGKDSIDEAIQKCLSETPEAASE